MSNNGNSDCLAFIGIMIFSCCTLVLQSEQSKRTREIPEKNYVLFEFCIVAITLLSVARWLLFLLLLFYDDDAAAAVVTTVATFTGLHVAHVDCSVII